MQAPLITINSKTISNDFQFISSTCFSHFTLFDFYFHFFSSPSLFPCHTIKKHHRSKRNRNKREKNWFKSARVYLINCMNFNDANITFSFVIHFFLALISHTHEHTPYFLFFFSYTWCLLFHFVNLYFMYKFIEISRDKKYSFIFMWCVFWIFCTHIIISKKKCLILSVSCVEIFSLSCYAVAVAMCLVCMFTKFDSLHISIIIIIFFVINFVYLFNHSIEFLIRNFR